MCPISKLQTGEKGIIKSYQGERAFVHHMQELGFLKNREIEVVQREGDLFIVRVLSNTKIMLSKDTAANIVVEKDESDE